MKLTKVVVPPCNCDVDGKFEQCGRRTRQQNAAEVVGEVSDKHVTDRATEYNACVASILLMFNRGS
jgi:hypothetical protein